MAHEEGLDVSVPKDHREEAREARQERDPGTPRLED